MLSNLTGFGLVALAFLTLLPATVRSQTTPLYTTTLSGEPTHATVILQARLEAADELVAGDLPGVPGWGYLEISTDSAFTSPRRTELLEATLENDFMLKAHVDGLSPATRYFYRAVAGRDREQLTPREIASFRTLPPRTSRDRFSFVMISCMHWEKFYGVTELAVDVPWIQVASGEDARLGYPGLETVLELNPGFVVGNGDNVYYDHPRDAPAKTREELRAKWHRLFALPRMEWLADRIPFYFLKDDHDYRWNDSWPTDPRRGEPSHALGVASFLEAVPVVDPGEAEPRTYRTYRVNELLQVWFLEGRDYRDPNTMEDGPEKSLWGEEQREWLKRTLEESDATFRILISPTPMVGPDDAYKRDNHTNIGGFAYEGAEFIRWLAENDLISPNVFVLNGDRHWQYHSIHPTGLEEFGSGALTSQNSRFGREPGDPNSTDPQGLIQQPYIQELPVGGFLHVSVEQSEAVEHPSILFTHYDETGEVLYAVRRYGGVRDD